MRLHGLDVARFVAFAGMVLVNFRIVADVSADTSWAAMITDTLEGRAAALFVILAGIGLALADPNRTVLFKRAMFLFVIGMLNLIIFEADILHFYALYFCIAIPFINARTWIILGLGFVTMAINLVFMFTLNFEAGWNWDTLEYSDFWTIIGFVRHSFFNGWHPVFPWIAFLFFGLCLGRQDLGNRQVQIWLVVGGLCLATSVSIAQAMLDPALWAAQVLTLAPIPPNPAYILASTGSAIAVIGIILLLTPWIERSLIFRAIVSAGRQALTLYILHILVGMGVLEYFDLLNGTLTSLEIFTFSIAFCAICVLYSVLWTRFISRGPLEWVMRKLT